MRLYTRSARSSTSSAVLIPREEKYRARLRAIVPRPLQQRSGGFLLELRLGSTVRVEINDICSKAGAEPCKRHGIIRRHRNKHLWAA